MQQQNIEGLFRTNKVFLSDFLAFGRGSEGNDLAATVNTLTTLLNDTLDFAKSSSEFTTQLSSPSAPAFDVQITDGVDDNTNVHLILTPTMTLASGAITLPALPGAVDKQEVLVNCTQEVTSFTVNANGATAVTGEPTTLSANDFFTLKLDLPSSTWYRVS